MSQYGWPAADGRQRDEEREWRAAMLDDLEELPIRVNAREDLRRRFLP